MITIDEARKCAKVKDVSRLPMSHMMPVDEWIIVTTWGWNYDENRMGYHAHIFKYLTWDRDKDAPVELLYSSMEDEGVKSGKDFARESEAGGWAMSMIFYKG